MVSLRSMRVGMAVMALWVFSVWMAWVPGGAHSAASYSSPPSRSTFISPVIGATESSTPPAFRILRPSTRRPVDAGSPFRPSKIRIELTYPGYATKQDITVTIGGRPAPIISLVPVRYLIEVQAPQQPARGRYDLEVTVKGVTVREPDAVTYFGVDNVNIVLTIDRSGSMGTAKMTAARDAARQFVDLMQVGDGIGIVGFDDRAETPLELTPILDAPPPSAFLFNDGMEFGPEKWIADPPWGLTSVARNSARAWTDSPAGNYANNVSSTLTIATPVTIPASMTAPALIFWHRYDIASSDRGDVRDGWYIDDVAIGPAWDDVRARAQTAIDTLNSRGSTSNRRRIAAQSAIARQRQPRSSARDCAFE